MRHSHQQQSRYAAQLEQALAALDEPTEQGGSALPDEEEAAPTIHVYPVEGGGVLFSPVPLEVDEQEEPGEPEEEGHPPVNDSLPPASSARRRPLPGLALFLLLVCLFLLLDAADSQLVFLLTPTVTITLTPQVRTLSLTSAAPLGRLLAPLTLSQSRSVSTTGHGHQDARAATGTLTFYNAAFTPQTVPAGTVVTASSGVQVVTRTSVTIQANSPPNDGVAQVEAQAALPGPQGNLPALAINRPFASALFVKNLTSFTGGQDARDFPVVSRADLEHAAATLKATVATSTTNALHSQLAPGESWLAPPSCAPTMRSDHAVGEEASRLTVTVSEHCAAIAYRAEAVQKRAGQLLREQATHALGAGYSLDGGVSVGVLHATVRGTSVWLAFACHGRWIYQLHPQQLVPLLLGKPRQEALRLLLRLPGIQQASITGIAGNAPLPADPQHFTFLEMEAF